MAVRIALCRGSASSCRFGRWFECFKASAIATESMLHRLASKSLWVASAMRLWKSRSGCNSASGVGAASMRW
ncbi:hypothetical protein D9M73_178260 [compost metagenome]